MAPMRSHLYELFRTLKAGRKVTFWYGVVQRAFLLGSFKALEKEMILIILNFTLLYPEPMEEDNWKVKEGLDGDGIERIQRFCSSMCD